MTEHDKNMTVTALSLEFYKTIKSLDLLDQVQSKVDKLRYLLYVILEEMHKDFGSESYFFKQP